MKKIEQYQIQEIIDILEGTCETLTGAIQEITLDNGLSDDDLTQEQLNEINKNIFLCSECGWWYEISCNSEESGICEDCYENSL